MKYYYLLVEFFIELYSQPSSRLGAQRLIGKPKSLRDVAKLCQAIRDAHAQAIIDCKDIQTWRSARRAHLQNVPGDAIFFGWDVQPGMSNTAPNTAKSVARPTSGLREKSTLLTTLDSTNEPTLSFLNHEGTVGMLQGGMSGQDPVVAHESTVGMLQSSMSGQDHVAVSEPAVGDDNVDMMESERINLTPVGPFAVCLHSTADYGKYPAELAAAPTESTISTTLNSTRHYPFNITSLEPTNNESLLELLQK